MTNEIAFDIIKMMVEDIDRKTNERKTTMKKVIFDGNDSKTVETLKSLMDNGELKKGVYTKVVFKSIKEAYKSYEKENGKTLIEKVTEGVVRFGIDYYNTATYKNKIIDPNKEPNRNGISQYDSLVSGYEDLLVETDRNGVVSHKIKMYASKSDSLRMVSKWYLNGVETTKSALEGIMKAESKPKNEDDFITFTVKAQNLISIGG